MIAQAGWRLVYGAGKVGFMGEVARAAGATTMGVIPTHLMGAEQGRADLSTLVITQNMHQRRKVMFMNADAIVLVPGGAGSLDELFEMLTRAQIGLHARPILLLNRDGDREPLIALPDHGVERCFAAPLMLGLFAVMPDVASFKNVLKEDTQTRTAG
jgi:hypothetical protein